MRSVLLGILVFSLLISELLTARVVSPQSNSAKELAGLWETKKRFGPEVRGTLFIRQTGENWEAEIAGRFASVTVAGDAVEFQLAGGKGKFRGKFAARRTKIFGYWTQPQGVELTPLLSPVILTKHGVGWECILPAVN